MKMQVDWRRRTVVPLRGQKLRVQSLRLCVCVRVCWQSFLDVCAHVCVCVRGRRVHGYMRTCLCAICATGTEREIV